MADGGWQLVAFRFPPIPSARRLPVTFTALPTVRARNMGDTLRSGDRQTPPGHAMEPPLAIPFDFPESRV
jgi:hypothetical protein